MAKKHFALERPRRIKISIPGYDADTATRLQGKIQSSQRKKGKNLTHKVVQASSPPAQVSPEEVQALNLSLRTATPEPDDLVEIFSGAPVLVEDHHSCHLDAPGQLMGLPVTRT